MMHTRLKNIKLGTLTSAAGLFVRRQFNTNGGNACAPTEKADCVVIGGGVVGIAVARQMALEGRDVLVLEAASTIGTATSSRNSEVIHAGIYYRPQSLKARLCVQGRKMLYDYCREHGVPHKQLGKLIVATSPLQIPVLENLQRVGVENGVTDLRMMEEEEAVGMEPELRCVKALWSPSTGIVDSHSLMLALQADAEEHGATFAFNTSVVRGHASENGIHLHISETKDMHTYVCDPHAPAQIILIPKTVINSAGLCASSLARRFHGLPSQAIPIVYYARGCYFTLSESGKSPFGHLIYPVPEDGGLGVHVTLDMGGQVRFGPDVEWLTDIDDTSCFLNMFEYTVDANRAQTFYPEIRKYYPGLRDGTLRPDYAGIRSKLSGPGEPAADFIIQEVPANQRADAANSLIYEANARIRDPVYGCMGVISALQQQAQTLQAELNAVRGEIMRYRRHQKAVAAAMAVGYPSDRAPSSTISSTQTSESLDFSTVISPSTAPATATATATATAADTKAAIRPWHSHLQ